MLNISAYHHCLTERMLKDRWGSRSLRLSKENMRAFYACYLCLQAAQQPVCCGEGHLFCKVCFMAVGAL